MEIQSFFAESEIARPALMSSAGRVPKCSACPMSPACDKGAAETPAAQVWVLSDKPLLDGARKILGLALMRAGLHASDVAILSPVAANVPPRATTEERMQACRCCHSRLLAMIRDGKPHVIFAVGYPAFYALYGTRTTDGKLLARSGKRGAFPMERWHGWQIPDGELGAYVCPLYGQSAIDKGQPILAMYLQEILSGLRLLLEPRPQVEDFDDKLVYYDFEEVRDALQLKNVPQDALVAFDYETTGLKPHRQGHEIACVSVCWGGKSYAFMVRDDAERRALLREVLTWPRRKVAANMKFEISWSRTILGVAPTRLYWDTMLMAHVLDNRDQISGVKFQSFVHFGVLDYNSHLSTKLEAPDSNAKNNVFSIHEHDLLRYCAMDSLLEWRLAQRQIAELKEAGGI